MPAESTQQSDEAIVHLVQQGDIESFGVLVERYEAKMLRYVRRLLLGNSEAEDIVQNIFIKAYTNIKSFDTDKRFSPWLYRIAHNEAINFIKKNKKQALPFFDADTLFPHPVANEKTDGEIKQKELETMLRTCLDKVDPKYREPLILYYLEELDYKAIADIMRIPTSTVGVRLRRGKQALQIFFIQEGYEL